MSNLLKRSIELCELILSERKLIDLDEVAKLRVNIEAELANPVTKPVGYISISMARIIVNGGSWDLTSMSQQQLAPDDIKLYTKPSKHQSINKINAKQETIEEILTECEKSKQRAIGWNITFLNGFERCLNVIKGMK